MPLSPIDVQQKTFRVALRGYAEDEVDEFLDEIVLSIREYEQRIEELAFQVGTLESQLVENRQTEDALRRTLLLAERTAEEITEEARREAERIVSEARTEAKALSAEQTRERDSLIAELHRLRHIVRDVKIRLSEVAGETQHRLVPLESDIDDALDDLSEGPEPAAVPAGSDEGGSARDPADATDVDEGDIDYWTKDPAPQPAGAEGATSAWSGDAVDDEDYEDEYPDGDEPAGNENEADDEADLSEYEDEYDDESTEREEFDAGDDESPDESESPQPDELQQEQDSASDPLSESAARRRPWERFGD